MRTVTFQSVLWWVASMMGLDPKKNMQGNQAEAIARYINSRVREGWESFDFAALRNVEERAFRDDYSTVKTYSIDDVVWDSITREYYQAVQSGTNQSLANTSYWKLFVNDSFSIPFEQTGKNPIGIINGIYSSDPRKAQNPREYLFVLDSEDFFVLEPILEKTAFIDFQIRASEFNAEMWMPNAIYKKGVIRYSPNTGDCYESLLDDNQNHQVTETAWWRKIPMPYVLAEFVKIAAYSDALREDGQTDKSTVEEARAYRIFENECLLQVGSQQQAKKFKCTVRR
jgi:hypothetical protein